MLEEVFDGRNTLPMKGVDLWERKFGEEHHQSYRNDPQDGNSHA
jgi:hypothetical protein